MDALYQKLNSWLDILNQELHELRINQHIFWEVQEIIKNNPKINHGNHFYTFMGSMYASAMSVAIRRQIDPDKRSVSFLRLLEEIRDNPTVVSRTRYKACYGNSPLPEEYQDDCFDRFVGPERDYVDAAVVANEIAELKSKTIGLKKYVNKRVAHYDQAKFKAFPKFQDVDDALDYLESLFKRYMQLFRAVHYDVKLYWQYDWKGIFCHAWIEK
jgi:hypothetical protein